MTDQKIRWETCPVCGKKNRHPDHPLCSQCNRDYNELAAESAANLEPFPNRVEMAYRKGIQTLTRMTVEHQEVAAVTQPVLQRAGREIQESLNRRIDRELFHQARLRRYRMLLEEGSPEVKEAAELERRLFAAICSLKAFLEGIEDRQEEADQPAPESEEAE
jgi:hypothetical protein